MRINNENNRIAFTSLGAMPLKGVFMTSGLHGIADEISSITPKTGLKVYSLDKNKNIISSNFLAEGNPKITWAQDLFSFTKNKLLVDTDMSSETGELLDIASKLCEYFDLKYEPHSYHLQGGNYILNETNNSMDLFVGKYDTRDPLFYKTVKRFDANNLYEIPQAASHIDAFMFIDGKRVFVCDDEMMLDKLAKTIFKLNHNGYKKLSNDLLTMYQAFKYYSESSPYAPTSEVIKAIEKTGYEPVRIPGRLYSFTTLGNQVQHVYRSNFANAILHKNSYGDTVLLTNESANDFVLGLDEAKENEINFSFKKLFLDSISPYIKRENVHFIKGKDNEIIKRLSCFGGLNCSTSGIV